VSDVAIMEQMIRKVMKDYRIAKAHAEGMTISQIAEHLEWSISTVRRSLKRTSSWYPPAAKPQPAALLANPPFDIGKDYEPACGTGAFLVQAADEAGKEAT
jgi:hypothetical protein